MSLDKVRLISDHRYLIIKYIIIYSIMIKKSLDDTPIGSYQYSLFNCSESKLKILTEKMVFIGIAATQP
jgi:hypothetical protein